MMKKKVLFLSILLGTTSIITAQIGINTSNPTATMDITAKNATGTTSNVDGLLVPRVDKQRAQSMTGVPTSTLIYINNIATGGTGGTTANVDATGYYYFDGTLWVKLTSPTGTNLNIYNSNGALNSTRTVDQGGFSLAFNNANIANAFSVDGTTFSVNGTNDRIGIGTAAPGAKLDLQGNMILGTANTATGSTGFSTVVRDNSTGELKVSAPTSMLVGGSIGDQITGVSLDIIGGTTTGNQYASATLATRSFTLDRPSIVEFNANVSLSFATTSNTTLTDGSVKMGQIYFNFTSAPAGIPTNTIFGTSSQSFTNVSGTNGSVFGSYYTTSISNLSLPAGNYTVSLIGAGASTQAFRITLGNGNSDNFQIKATPIQ
ncbi:hypothetical protein [Chryseobacterium glaciei]|nr:hypothetical protein [Chryseobacterium glaciei]